MPNDPLGTQPRPLTGTRIPTDFSPEAAARSGEVIKTLRGVWIDHPPQLANISQLMQYRIATLNSYGTPIDGRWLREETQAGKSALAWRLKYLLERQSLAAGHTPNPYQVLIVTIKKGMTIKGFLQAVLQQMGDDYLDVEAPRGGQKAGKNRDDRSIEMLEIRVARWAKELKVELLVVEEVQRLATNRADARQITEQFQTMLDRGVVPLVLMGTRDSAVLFEQNNELCARLGTPLDLQPVSGADESSASMFQDFCEGFDEAMVETGIFNIRSNLDEPYIAEPLARVSGGHVGRAARIIKEAAAAAVARNAEYVEPFDLSNATRRYAMPNRWIDEDPFSR